MNMSIPAFHVSTNASIRGDGIVKLPSRVDGVSSGILTVKIITPIHFDPAVDDYPAGTVMINSQLNDGLHGTFTSTSIDLVNAFGGSVKNKIAGTPTAFVTGRCIVDPSSAPAGIPLPRGLRFWLMVVDNKGTPTAPVADVVSFAVHDRNGLRVAYGSGALTSGDFLVAAEP